MVKGGRDLKAHLVPAPTPWAGISSTTPRCSELHPTWPCTLPGREHPQLLWANMDSPSAVRGLPCLSRPCRRCSLLPMGSLSWHHTIWSCHLCWGTQMGLRWPRDTSSNTRAQACSSHFSSEHKCLFKDDLDDMPETGPRAPLASWVKCSTP